MRMKKWIALLLIFSLGVGLTACSAADTGDPRLYGEWKGTVDITQQLTGTDVPLPMEEIGFDLVFFFEEDGRFEVIIDQYSVTLMIDRLIDVVIETYAQQADTLQISREELKDRIKVFIEEEDLVDRVEDSFQSGYYVYRDGVIYLSAEEEILRQDPQLYNQEYLEVELSEQVLKITNIVGDSRFLNVTVTDILPFEMHKQ